VLVAEDLRVNQMIVDAMLKAAGHEVTVVANGAEAIQAARTGGFDLILMDIEMPQVDGIEATRAIRDLGGAPGRIPIIALTANAMLEEVSLCRDAGMNDHLTKPIDRARLLELVDRWTERAIETAPAAAAH
jgi:CheY-like chemotaxis protein